MSADAVFAALGDPTRRHIVETLAAAPATATVLSKDLPMSRQAVAKHLAMLSAAELVSAERRGRETLYTLRLEPLREVTRWVETVGDEWADRLSRLERAIRD
ncbi:MAG: ArsR family transcriptional regulator [Mycobacterium sp.]|nr:MAG: ArsR family transcriptional regulator [Mycobacterium sp.]